MIAGQRQWIAVVLMVSLSVIVTTEAFAQATVPAETEPVNVPATSRLSDLGNRRLPDRGTGGGNSMHREWLQLLLALAIVVGLIFLARYVLRRLGAVSKTRSVSGSIEVLTKVALTGKHQVFLVRVGGRVLVLGCGPQGLVSLAQVTQQEEVERLQASGVSRPAGPFGKGLKTGGARAKWSHPKMMIRGTILVLCLLVIATCAAGEQPVGLQQTDLTKALPKLTSPEGVSSALRWLVLITLVSLAPAILIMVTCFTRIIVVLGLLRQALTTQNMPPNQILFGLAIFMTLVVMAPVYGQVYGEAVRPYMDGQMTAGEAVGAGQQTVRGFLIGQIERADNTDDVYLFLDSDTAAKDELTWGDVSTLSLIPAFVVSELKVAFTMGFRIYLPFLIIDMLVASVLVSMGMLMLPPVLVSLPFKLLLFVLADGWHLVVGTLIRSFQ